MAHTLHDKPIHKNINTHRHLVTHKGNHSLVNLGVWGLFFLQKPFLCVCLCTSGSTTYSLLLAQSSLVHCVGIFVCREKDAQH